MELRSIVDWTLRPHLMAVPGVADVNVFGGEIKQLQIQVNPEKLVLYNVSMQTVMEAAGKATGVRGAGFLENNNQRIIINTEGQSVTASQLAQTTLVHKGGQTVRLGDIGRIVEGATPSISASAINGKTGGGADQMARFIQGVVAKHKLMKQPVIVVNKSDLDPQRAIGVDAAGGAGLQDFFSRAGAPRGVAGHAPGPALLTTISERNSGYLGSRIY